MMVGRFRAGGVAVIVVATVSKRTVSSSEKELGFVVSWGFVGFGFGIGLVLICRRILESGIVVVAFVMCGVGRAWRV
jgi:hypothetical protein